jgi:UDP-3-O-[3-hydroxymyristoyl] glucosamine N-acyltransferase
LKLGLIAQQLGCELKGDANIDIQRVTGIDEARPGDLTFLSNRKYASSVKTTSASAVILEPSFPDIAAATLRTANPYLAFARAVELFYQESGSSHLASIHPRGSRPKQESAVTRPSDRSWSSKTMSRSAITASSSPFVHICRGARIGNDFKAYAHVSVREFCRIGNNVILQDGAKIGTDGYGYAKKDDGSYYKIVQSGIVVLEDDVEVGANSTIDRGTIGGNASGPRRQGR